MRSTLFLVIIMIWLPGQHLLANTFDHSNWGQMLQQHVHPINQGVSTEVDYAAFAEQRPRLKKYLNQLAQVNQKQFDSWEKQTQLAFLINAYNAWTIELILTKWPNLKSIKELGSILRSPWKKEFIPLLGKTRSLDNIEHDLIRGSGLYQDSRIHFAVNCASIGCPALRAEAFTGLKLEQQLQEQTTLFLQDRSRNRAEEDTIYLSSIFKWYQEDFEKGWLKHNSLEEFLIEYADALNLSSKQITALRNKDMDIDFLDYDWQLNKKR